jgi:hypothetical protein
VGEFFSQNRFFRNLWVRIALPHVFLVFLCVGFQPLKLSYWDSGWYRGLVDHGYSNTFPDGQGNVGFFPGFPVTSSFLKSVFGLGQDLISTDAALLLTALLFALMMWKLLSRWLEVSASVSTELQCSGFTPGYSSRTRMIFFALYPFSFFFYAAYSESMFTALVVGFILFSEKWIVETKPKKSFGIFALVLIFGFWMCFTRLLGLTFVFYPLFRALQTKVTLRSKPLSQLLGAGLIFILSSLGCVSFFIYSSEKFGAWDFYFQSERKIWGTFFDWHKLVPPTSLFHFLPPFSGDTVGKLVTVIFGYFLTRKLWQLLRLKSYSEPVLALVLVSGMYWGANLLGRTSWNFGGMGRYLLPAIALMLPYIPVPEKPTRVWWVLGLIFLALQIGYIITFAHHGWVA